MTRATLELLHKETPEFIPPQMWPSNLPNLNPVGYCVWALLQENFTKHVLLTYINTETATENRVGQLGLKLQVYVISAEAIRQ